MLRRRLMIDDDNDYNMEIYFDLDDSNAAASGDV